MRAREKLDALGIKVVHELVRARRPETALETVYRWRNSLKSGRGIPDDRKRLLIEATAESPHPIRWGDFELAECGQERAT